MPLIAADADTPPPALFLYFYRFSPTIAAAFCRHLPAGFVILITYFCSSSPMSPPDARLYADVYFTPLFSPLILFECHCILMVAIYAIGVLLLLALIAAAAAFFRFFRAYAGC